MKYTNLKIAAWVLPALLIAGCSSVDKKDDELNNAAGAGVETQGLGDQMGAGGEYGGRNGRSGRRGGRTGSGEGGAEFGGGRDGSSASSDPALDDPNSPLANRTVYFDFDSSEIRADSTDILRAHAGYMSQNRSAQVTLEGHTDERGTREYNLALGERRAHAVKQFLTAEGVSPAQVREVSYGEERPVDAGSGEAAWAQNRRVELVY